MFAIIETGGRQYKICEGDILEIELLKEFKEQKDVPVELKNVLLYQDERQTLVGKPYLENVVVKGTLLQEVKDDKVLVFKKKPKKGFKRLRGHRQQYHQIKIEKIELISK